MRYKKPPPSDLLEKLFRESTDISEQEVNQKEMQILSEGRDVTFQATFPWSHTMQVYDCVNYRPIDLGTDLDPKIVRELVSELNSHPQVRPQGIDPLFWPLIACLASTIIGFVLLTSSKDFSLSSFIVMVFGGLGGLVLTLTLFSRRDEFISARKDLLCKIVAKFSKHSLDGKGSFSLVCSSNGDWIQLNRIKRAEAQPFSSNKPSTVCTKPRIIPNEEFISGELAPPINNIMFASCDSNNSNLDRSRHQSIRNSEPRFKLVDEELGKSGHKTPRKISELTAEFIH